MCLIIKFRLIRAHLNVTSSINGHEGSLYTGSYHFFGLISHFGTLTISLERYLLAISLTGEKGTLTHLQEKISHLTCFSWPAWASARVNSSHWSDFDGFRAYNTECVKCACDHHITNVRSNYRDNLGMHDSTSMHLGTSVPIFATTVAMTNSVIQAPSDFQYPDALTITAVLLPD